MRRRVTRSPDDRSGGDEGQIALMVLLYTLICLSLVAVAVNASAVHLARTQLLDTADAAALNAAEALDQETVYATGVSEALPLSAVSVREQVEVYVASYQPPSRLSDVAIGPDTGSGDGSSATVELSGLVRLPIAASVVKAWHGGITVTVRSTARTTLTP